MVSQTMSWRLHKEIGVKKKTAHGIFVDGAALTPGGIPHVVRYLPADSETPNLHAYFVMKFEEGKESPVFKHTINTDPKIEGPRTIHYPKGFRRHAEMIANHARDTIGLKVKIAAQRKITRREHAINIAEDT